MTDTALVTGSNRGLGLEWVRQLAGPVDRLFATCRRPGDADELGELAARHPDTVDVGALDVADSASVDDAVARVRREVDALDLLVNNAGISGGGGADRYDTVDADTMMEVYRVNAVGPHLLTRALAPLLRTGGSSTVVNVTSQLGSIARTSGGGWQSYKASKAALNMCTRLQAAALEDGGGIVVAMHPGWVRTDMGGSGARLSPADSVAGMLEVIGTLSPDDTGRFLAYDGEQLPW